ncbi:YrrS family protein [Halobacillus litoralis]|nr:YrrS family protein [Halobacillus litoralis]
MNEKHTSKSRANRFEKKRRSTKWLTWLIPAGSVLAVLFISVLIFGGDDQKGQAQKSEETPSVESETEEDQNNQDAGEEETQSSDSADENKEEQEEPSDKQKVSLEGFEELKPIEDEEGLKIEKSEDPNVERVVTKDWSVVATEQELSGEHRITYEEGSKDYQELLQAVRNAVGLSEDNIIYWWVGNGGGPNKAVATVSDKNETGYLRVHVEWVDGQGYKPVKLEVLKEKEVNR